MSSQFLRLSLTLLAMTIVAAPAAADIVRVEYEGVINHVGASTPDGFSIGQRVWGEFAYDALAVEVEHTLLHQYPAIRQLSA